MRTFTLLLVLGLTLGACSKSPSSKKRGFSPIHTNLQIMIENGQGGSSATQPELKNDKFDAQVRAAYKGSLKTGDGPECSAEIEYRGTQDDKDYYWVTVTAPPGAVGVPSPAELAYNGREIELWKDSSWRIRIRPIPSGEPDRAANESHPIRSDTNSTSSTADSRH